MPFFVHLFYENGISVKAATLRKVPLSSVKELQSFLGLVNWFRDLIPNCANVALPLTKLLTTSATWVWTSSQQQALEALVDHIQSEPLLNHFKDHCFYWREWFRNRGWMSPEDPESDVKPIHFWSRKLRTAELNYAIPEKELLAIVSLTEANRPYFTKLLLKRITNRVLSSVQFSVNDSVTGQNPFFLALGQHPRGREPENLILGHCHFCT